MACNSAHKDVGVTALAIIGFAFEFPDDVTTSESFWQMLCDGRSASTEFPPERLNIDGFYHPDSGRPSSIPVRGGHFVKEDLGAFDAPFFSITPGEAACMDPQHRRLLEVSYHALENAGLPMNQCIGSETAVYTGCFTNDYLNILQQDLEAEQRHAIMGVAPSMLANRLSWFYNFKGTSTNLDSACSSSLVALHLACQDLKAGNCSMAMVGGANLIYHPNFMKMMTDFNFLSKDSRSWSFDSRANGYARGEGHAILILKRLSDALQNGDTIRAIIRNTGSNQDGRTPGITQPNGDAQISLIRHAYQQAGLDMTPTRFFEAHGTGTPVGDPIEANAIGTAFSQYRSSQDPLYIGAVKANIGHLEGCSGLAGVIKAILVIENGIIPPIAGFTSPNPEIKVDKFHLHFPTQNIPWPVSGLRRACVNSFGFGGTNAIVILDDAQNFLQSRGLHGFHQTKSIPFGNGPDQITPGIEANDQSQLTPKLLVMSAPENNGAQRLIAQYSEFISGRSRDWASISYTLASRRTQYPWRSYAVVDPLTSADSDTVSPRVPIKAHEDARVAFVFTGQGAQYIGMGRELLRFNTFSQSLIDSDNYLVGLGCTWSVCKFLRGELDNLAIDNPEYSQTLTTCLQIALVDLLYSFGVSPSVVLGHSSGEIAAAYTCGAISHGSAVRVAFYRGLLSARLSTRSKSILTMMAVGISLDGIATYIDRLANESGIVGCVQVGCVNSPRSITLTGPWSELSQLENWLQKDKVFTRRLQVPIAYHHSHYMSKIADEYLSLIGSLDEQRTDHFIPMVSTVTGELCELSTLRQGRYWIHNLTSTVEFQKAFTYLALQSGKKPHHRLGKRLEADLRATRILEIGPHSVLKGPIRDILQHLSDSNHQISNLVYLPTLVRQQHAAESLLQAVGELWCAGLTSINISSASDLRPGLLMVHSGLPSYPFDHTQMHWKEGRLSRNLRFRDTARHDLLGTRSLDWNPQIAQWRNFLRLAEVPWLKDHTIAGQVVFPAAGMIVMAIEALKQLHSGAKVFKGALIRNARFFHAIVFSKSADYIETQLTIAGPGPGSDSQESEFRLFVIENGDYIECCHCTIRSITEEHDMKRNLSCGPWRPETTPETWSRQVQEACAVVETEIYSSQEDGAILYGPCFQNLQHVRFGIAGQATALLNTENWKLNSTDNYPTPDYTVHPSTLDGLAQLLVPAISCQHSVETIPTMVPTYIRTLWIQDNPSIRTGDLRVSAKFQMRGYRGAAGEIAAFGTEPNNPLVIMNGLETTIISSAVSEPPRVDDKVPPICHRLKSRPHPSLITHDQLRAYCVRDRPAVMDQDHKNHRRKSVAIVYFIEHALARSEIYASQIAGSHFASYVDWMEHQVQLIQQEELSIDHTTLRKLHDNPEYRELYLAQIQQADVEGQLLVSLGRKLVHVLAQEINPLEVMFGEELIYRYYDEMLANDHYFYPAGEIVDLLSHHDPSMRILEVGAGTGAITERLLEKMSEDGVFKCARYDYTDISPAFFDSARSKLQKYCHAISFRILNIARDPVVQSFDAGSYDLIIASHVLHATEDLLTSLSNVRTLLKPEGKLLLLETTNPDSIHTGFLFGLLKDWWAPLSHEKRSTHSPCLALGQWDDLLKSAGFSGIDVAVPGQDKTSSIIFTNAVGEGALFHEVKLVIDDASTSQRQAAGLLRASSGGDAYEVLTLSQFVETPINPETIVVFLLELDSVFLYTMSAAQYQQLKPALLRPRRLLWVTRCLRHEDPRHGLIDGLSRALMSEDSSKRFATLALDAQSLEEVANSIRRMTKMIAQDVARGIENVFSLQGVNHVSRVTENHTMDTVIANANSNRHKQEATVSGNRQLGLHVRLPGRLQTLEWRQLEEEAADFEILNENEVLVQTRSIGLNRRDYEVATGRLDGNELGLDISGIVLAAGPNSEFASGDRVFTVLPSTGRTRMKLGSQVLSRFPPRLDFPQAASMPSSLWIAYHAFTNIARPEAGETILICQGASCVGQMGLQLAFKTGVNVLVTASSDEKSRYLQHRWGLPASDIFDPCDPSILTKITQRTRGYGVNVVLGSLKDLEFDWTQCLSPFARVVDTTLNFYGDGQQYTSGESNPPNIMRSSVNLVALLHRKPQLVYQIFRKAVEMAFDCNLQHPGPLLVFETGEIETAFSHLNNRKEVKKCIIELQHDGVIPEAIVIKKKNIFSPNASYVVAGGFGGLGRGILAWMATLGARHLIVLSRSGARTEEARSLLRALLASGISVAAPRVDVSNLEAVKECLSQLKSSTPPIRGCIQATVAMRDNLWENMGFEDWCVSTGAKATGSWNLHVALPTDLDFFVLISSVNGIFGNRSQANYSAGNSFKDALAHHRIEHGQKAISIDLGLMVDRGLVAENDKLLTSMRRLGHLIDIHMRQLLALMEHYCDPDLPLLSHDEAQVIVGIETPSAVLAKGVDLHHAIRRPIFSHLFAIDRSAESRNELDIRFEEIDRVSILRKAESDADAINLVTQWMRTRMSQVLGLSTDDVDMSKPPHAYGIDSLIAIDMRAWIRTEMGADIQVFNLLGNLSLDDLSCKVALESSFR